MSEKVTATFIVIYPIFHEVLHILMYMLWANCIFFMKYAFLFSVHFPAELVPFPWFIDTPYTMAILLLFILYIAKILFQAVTFVFLYSITHRKKFHMFTYLNLLGFPFLVSALLSCFMSFLPKILKSLLYFLLVLLFFPFFVRWIASFYLKS